MNFTESEPCSGIAAFSPSGEWLATVKPLQIAVLDVSTQLPVSTFPVNESISFLEWSPNSGYLLCSNLKRGLILLYSITDQLYLGKLTSSRSLVDIHWSPDSSSILGIQEMQLQVVIWSLRNNAITTIRSPKHQNTGIDFSNDGKFMAVLEKNDGKDQIGVYFTQDWSQIGVFNVEMIGAEDLMWTKRGQIVVWEGVMGCNCLVYAADGGLVCKLQLEGLILGVKMTEKWGNWVALGMREPTIRVISTISWKQVADLQHNSVLSDSPNPRIYQEIEETTQSDDFSRATTTTIRFKVARSMSKLPTIKQSKLTQTSITGLSWSRDGRYVAARSEVSAGTVLIWESERWGLEAVVVLLGSVRGFAWSPRKNMLAVTCGGGRVYLWSEEGAGICEVPREEHTQPEPPFSVLRLKWNSTGSALLLLDRSSFRLAYPQFTVTN